MARRGTTGLSSTLLLVGKRMRFTELAEAVSVIPLG
jgi:hypothetical protein